jgi:hypothetical protein
LGIPSFRIMRYSLRRSVCAFCRDALGTAVLEL